jgi:plasmid stabilization system protein ParE
VKLVVAREAVADLERLHAFLVNKNPRAAQRAVAAISNALHSLDVFPDRGRPSGIAGARELVVPFGRLAYVVRYAHLAERDEIVILRIWHGREQRR